MKGSFIRAGAARIGVAVTMLGRDNRMRMLTGKAVVRSRPWALGTLDAKLEYSSLPGDPNHWGLYKRPTLADNMFENVGTGPWEGTFYIFSPPRWIGEPKMYVHTDFKPSGNRYPIDPKKHQDSIAIRTCKVSGSLNVHDLNSACGDSVALGNFHDLMVAHEKMHQRSLNECITTVNRWRGRLAEIEGIVRDESGKAEEEANALWASIYADLEEAYFTDQKGQKSDSIWSWRPSGPWLDDPVRLVDHNGRRGCP
ncbi:MAG: hypothetical protein J4F34_01890 [Gemmatimonadetes bacterium]|nr:hypothetical protein [Gemmatimonadota bacterium]